MKMKDLRRFIRKMEKVIKFFECVLNKNKSSNANFRILIFLHEDLFIF